MLPRSPVPCLSDVCPIALIPRCQSIGHNRPGPAAWAFESGFIWRRGVLLYTAGYYNLSVSFGNICPGILADLQTQPSSSCHGRILYSLIGVLRVGSALHFGLLHVDWFSPPCYLVVISVSTIISEFRSVLSFTILACILPFHTARLVGSAGALSVGDKVSWWAFAIFVFQCRVVQSSFSPGCVRILYDSSFLLGAGTTPLLFVFTFAVVMMRCC